MIEIPLNETIDSWNTPVLVIPPRFLDLGSYKAVFRMHLDTGNEDLKLFGETHHYFTVEPAPLVPVLTESGATKTSRGWGQMIEMNPEEYSFDPDNPEEVGGFNYTWFCRVVAPEKEKFALLDDEGFPVYNEDDTITASPPLDVPDPLNQGPGCFGDGAGGMRMRGGRWSLNASQFVTPGRIYEITVIIEKDIRRAAVSLQVEVFAIPAPITSMHCMNDELLCFPNMDTVLVNPSIRLALEGECKEECDGEISYKWNIDVPDGVEAKYFLCSRRFSNYNDCHNNNDG